jgi:hypothetical protein
LKEYNWRTLNDAAALLTEEEAKTALEHESANRRRASILIRLHQRYCTLRMERERAALLDGVTSP